MIEPIYWPQPRNRELASPFQRGQNERPLRVTFDSSALTDAPLEEMWALEVLNELSMLPEIYALQTGAGSFPRIEIETTAENDLAVSVYKAENKIRQTAIFNVSRLRHVAASLAAEAKVDSSNVESIYGNLLVIEAHDSLHQDILVTLSPLLLERRSHGFLKQANLRTPSEAARILGLFLRSRANYTYSSGLNNRVTLKGNRGFFYSSLVTEF